MGDRPSWQRGGRLRGWVRRPAIALIALLVFLGALGAGARAILTRDLRAARRAVASRRIDQAEAPLKRWLAAHPDSAEAHLLLGRIEFARSHNTAATAALKRAYELGLRGDPFDRLRALLLVRNGHFAEAEPTLLRLCMAEREADPEVYEALVGIFLDSYRLNEAERVLDRWKRDVPDDAKLYLWRAEVDRLAHSEDLDRLESDYREALKRDPKLLMMRLALADLLRLTRRCQEAAAHYDLYLAARPNDAAALVSAARNAQCSGDRDSASRFLTRALAQNPDDTSALMESALLDFHGGAAHEAVVKLDRAIHAAPFNAELLAHRSRALIRIGKDADASADADRVRQLVKDQAELEKAFERLLDEPNSVALHHEIARWMFAHGKPDTGARWARKTLALDPDHIESNRLMVEYHQRRGEPGLANHYRLQAGSLGAR